MANAVDSTLLSRSRAARFSMMAALAPFADKKTAAVAVEKAQALFRKWDIKISKTKFGTLIYDASNSDECGPMNADFDRACRLLKATPGAREEMVRRVKLDANFSGPPISYEMLMLDFPRSKAII